MRFSAFLPSLSATAPTRRLLHLHFGSGAGYSSSLLALCGIGSGAADMGPCHDKKTSISTKPIPLWKQRTRGRHIDPYALKWLFTDNDFVDTDMDQFLEGLPGYVHSYFTVEEDLPKVLTAPYFLRRIREHLMSCATATELSEQARIKRHASIPLG